MESGDLVWDSEKNTGSERNFEGSVGVLDVYIHEARDIHNICIYQNQDVYAKLYLTSNPERTVASRIINRGGRNPVFDENVRLNVEKIESSLKVEIWMLSRVRNYLEDQLLGFTLVPLCDVLIENGKPAREFSLTSSDLYHAPAGFVQLTLTYTGASSEVLEIPAPLNVLNGGSVNKETGVDDDIPCELFDKIEFPDPEIMNENEQMASEYFEIPCPVLDCNSTDQSLPHQGHDNQASCNQAVCPGVDIGSQGDINSLNAETPPATSEAAMSQPGNVPANLSPEAKASGLPGLKNQDTISELGNRSISSSEVNRVPPEAPIAKPLINVSIEQEPKVVQEEIVEMYMKSMQQFTETLAKMKLPAEFAKASSNESSDDNSSNSSFGEKPHAAASKGNEPSPRVFYGSRAFF
ncbi:OLC1v1024869C1 [Oldenlandia corymbosa var. corymbosa]|uniref:OLC1v1024869C1 n=1 Tax=Oldenlandia corymbosa var. corymbosa TaxID=529605 RepID=A0AAV1C3J9_OLDCO|nr:OLC1v1024869C1 [Oldenlandia corymbosa var. corymbosa]